MAEVIYHAYQQQVERGLKEWVATFEEARRKSQYALCEALRTVGAEFSSQRDRGGARVAQEEGEYLLVRSRYAEADEALQASVTDYNESLRLTPDYINTYRSKGITLRLRGALLAKLSRHEEAERSFDEAVAASNEALRYAPDDAYAHSNKGNALGARGALLAELSRREDADQSYAAAVIAYGEALLRAPNYIAAHQNKALTLLGWGAYMRSFVQDEVTRARWEQHRPTPSAFLP
jgi:tetratricopeptide (TPR) repeat protein